jgi:hypothetical protein
VEAKQVLLAGGVPRLRRKARDATGSVAPQEMQRVLLQKWRKWGFHGLRMEVGSYVYTARAQGVTSRHMALNMWNTQRSYCSKCIRLKSNGVEIGPSKPEQGSLWHL